MPLLRVGLVGSSNTASTCRMPSSQCRIIKLKSPQDRSNITCRNQRCIVMSLSCTFFGFSNVEDEVVRIPSAVEL